MPLALAMLRESPGLWPVWAAAPRTNAGVINEGVIRPADLICPSDRRRCPDPQSQESLHTAPQAAAPDLQSVRRRNPAFRTPALVTENLWFLVMIISLCNFLRSLMFYIVFIVACT